MATSEDRIRESFLESLRGDDDSPIETGVIVKVLREDGLITVGSLREATHLPSEAFHRAMVASLENGLISLSTSIGDNDAKVSLTSTGEEIAKIA